MQTVHTWDPFRNLWDVKADLDRVFSARTANAEGSATLAEWTPAVDVVENAEEGFIHLAVELPGLTRDDVKITIDENTLSIAGERKQTFREQKRGFARVERAYGSFARSFTLPTTVDAGKISAEMKDGVLHLRLPKREEARPRQIEVKVA